MNLFLQTTLVVERNVERLLMIAMMSMLIMMTVMIIIAMMIMRTWMNMMMTMSMMTMMIMMMKTRMRAVEMNDDGRLSIIVGGPADSCGEAGEEC